MTFLHAAHAAQSRRAGLLYPTQLLCPCNAAGAWAAYWSGTATPEQQVIVDKSLAALEAGRATVGEWSQ
jgi:hypothetical protein